MGNIFKVSSIDTQLRDTPDNPVPHNQKEMERTKNDSNASFSDIYEIRQQCLNFNRACLMSKTESIASIRKEMQDMVHNIKFSGMFIIKDISFNEQIQARQLLDS